VVWLPAYLIRGAGFSPTEAGWIVTSPALSQIILVPGVCVFAEWLRRRGTSNRLACGWVSGACMVVAGLATAALPIVHGTALTVLCTIFAFFSGGVAFSLCPVTVAEITPMAQRGLALAIGNATATLAGVLAPAVTRMIVDSGANAVDGFRTGFVVTGLAVNCVAVLTTYMIDPETDATRLGSVTPPRTLFNENVLAGEANAG
jgi:MFS transporter, ACS family, D-galactonate transporter